MKLFQIFINLICIYFLVIKKTFKGQKIIIFHHPSNKLINNTDVYIKFLFSNLKKDFLVIYTHESKNLKRENFFYITQGYLKLIYGINFFISSYVCDYFTPNSKKIYIHHDIYDTPLAEKEKYNLIIKKIGKYDYIFVSSIITKKFFEKNFQRYFTKHKPKIIITGYIKFDFLLNKLKNFNKKKNSVVIAPTNYLAYKDSLLIKDLQKTISKLLSFRKYKIILRPHPSNKDDPLMQQIAKKFKKEKKFSLNYDKNYLNLYSSSLCLITDISGTAYTYAFLTENPVIFFDNYKKKISKTYFFNDRKKIGYICNSTVSMMTKLKSINKYKNDFKEKIINLKKQRLANQGKVKKIVLKFIYEN